MKLHLPVSLFAALMAVISALPTFADVTVKIGGEDWNGSWEQYEASGDYIIDEDMEITLSGEDGQLTLPTDKSFVQRGDITIRITDGACLKGDGYSSEVTYQFGSIGKYIRTEYMPTKKEYTAKLMIDGGSASFSSDYYNSVMFGELSVIGEEHDDVRLHVNIDVKNGNLDIAADRANCAYCAKTNGQVDSAVTIGAGGIVNFSVHEEACYWMFYTPNVLPSMGYNNANATLTIQDGGILNLGVASFGCYYGISDPKAPCQLTVEVSGAESWLNLHGGNIGLVISTDYEIEGTVTVDGGRLTMSDNSIRGVDTFSPSIAYADGEGTETMEMTICHGGTVEMQTGKIGYARTTPGDDATTVNLNLTLEDTSSLTMGSGTIAGTEGDNSHVDATITMTGDSQFTMAGGAVGKGKGTDLTINMEGGSFTASAGSIGEGAASCELNLKGGSFTVEEGASFTGNINVHSGSLSLAEGSYKSTAGKHVSIQLDNPAGADLGGLDASLIKEDLSISAAGATLRGLKAGSTLTLGGEGSAANVITVGSGSAALTKGGTSSDSGEKKNIIEFQGEGGTIQLADGCKVTLNFGEDEFLGELSGKENVEIQVHLTNAQLSATDGNIVDHFELEAGWGLSVESYTVTADGGILTLTGNTTGVANLDGTQSDFTGVSDADKVIVTGDTTLASTAEQGGTLKRLQGEHNLTVKGEGEVELYNDGDLFNADGNTTFGGKLATEEGVTLKKTGEDSLTLGSLQAEGGVTVEDGKLVLTGDDNSIGGTLTLGEGGTLEVEQDGQLTLSGSVSEESTGALTGNGTVILDGDIKFGNVKLGEDLTIQMGEHCGSVDFGDTPVTLPDLNGTSVKGNVTVTGPGEFSGTFDGTLTVRGEQNLTNKGNGNCELVVEGQRGQASLAPGSTYGSVTNGGDPNGDMKGGKLVVAADENGSKAGAGITVHKDIIFRNGAETNFVLNMSDPNLWGAGEHDATMLTTTQTIWIEPETSFVIDGLEETLHEAKGDLRNVIILHGTTIENKNYKPSNTNSIGFFALVRTDEAPALLAEGSKTIVNAKVDLGFTLNQLYENVQLWRMDNGDVGFDADRRTDSKYASYAKTTNGKTGLNLLWQNYNRNNGNVSQEEQSIIQELERLSGSNNAAEASRVMAAVAGSTLTSLSAAQSAALRNQMGRVRDHALQAGRLRCAGNDEATAQQRPCKNSHVWVEGTSFFSEQHSVGDESGYRLNSWGGALGIDAQVDAHWSVGVSLSASYGDLEARAADYAKGDLDTYTVSFWSQAKNGRWGNTLLFTLGTNEADLKRAVNYGAGSYTATSNTSGSSLGAMWELTYDFHPVKDNKSNILQPLFNVAVMRTSMDGFSEKNAGNVGLTTEKQTRDTVTLGLGLRWLAAINSAKAVNRTVSTEVHANVAQDMGDRRSVANVALLADPSYTQNVYGSKAGSTAFQFGAGVNVPMTPNSQIYMNAGGELREHANAWNAALGVRMGF